jgi:hypothetical protein
MVLALLPCHSISDVRIAMITISKMNNQMQFLHHLPALQKKMFINLHFFWNEKILLKVLSMLEWNLEKEDILSIQQKRAQT